MKYDGGQKACFCAKGNPKYTLKIIDECGLRGKPCCVSYWWNHKLALATESVLDDATWYHRLIGKLIYLTITRPKLTYTMQILPQFMQSPKEEHIEAARRVLCHLKGSASEGIFLHAHIDLQLYGYCDSDLRACLIFWKPLTCYLVTLGCSPISWKIKIVSRSSAEAEYMTMTVTTSKLV